MSNTITKPKQSIGELAMAAARILPANHSRLTDPGDRSAKNTEHRYMVFKLLDKAGHTHEQIADSFKLERSTVTKGIQKIDDWMRIYKDMRDTYGRLELLALNTL